MAVTATSLPSSKVSLRLPVRLSTVYPEVEAKASRPLSITPL